MWLNDLLKFLERFAKPDFWNGRQDSDALKSFLLGKGYLRYVIRLLKRSENYLREAAIRVVKEMRKWNLFVGELIDVLTTEEVWKAFAKRKDWAGLLDLLEDMFLESRRDSDKKENLEEDQVRLPGLGVVRRVEHPIAHLDPFREKAGRQVIGTLSSELAREKGDDAMAIAKGLFLLIWGRSRNAELVDVGPLVDTLEICENTKAPDHLRLLLLKLVGNMAQWYELYYKFKSAKAENSFQRIRDQKDADQKLKDLAAYGLGRVVDAAIKQAAKRFQECKDTLLRLEFD